MLFLRKIVKKFDICANFVELIRYSKEARLQTSPAGVGVLHTRRNLTGYATKEQRP